MKIFFYKKDRRSAELGAEIVKKNENSSDC